MPREKITMVVDSNDLPRASDIEDESIPQSSEDEVPESSEDEIPESSEDEVPESSEDEVPESSENESDEYPDPDESEGAWRDQMTETLARIEGSLGEMLKAVSHPEKRKKKSKPKPLLTKRRSRRS